MKTPTVTFFLRGGQKRTFRTAHVQTIDFPALDVKREGKQSTERFYMEGDKRIVKKYIEWAKS